MNVGAVSAWKAANREVGAARYPAQGITRRRLGGTAASAAFLGGALGSALFKPALADTSASFTPVPIPRGSPFLGGSFHVFGPNAIDPIDAEPITITNLNGFVGLAYISGMVTQTNTQTGETLRLPFINSDMRFMQGVFRGADGRIHQGTFALV
jgi:hypothetical protein